MSDPHIKGQLMNIPGKFEESMRNRNWMLRSRIIWHRTDITKGGQEETRCKVDYNV